MADPKQLDHLTFNLKDFQGTYYLMDSTARSHIADKGNPHGVTKAQVGLGSVADIDQSKAIKSITRNGTTFTATALDGTTFTFDQQDNGGISAEDKTTLDTVANNLGGHTVGVNVPADAKFTDTNNVNLFIAQNVTIDSSTGEVTFTLSSEDETAMAKRDKVSFVFVPTSTSEPKDGLFLQYIPDEVANLKYILSTLWADPNTGVHWIRFEKSTSDNIWSANLKKSDYATNIMLDSTKSRAVKQTTLASASWANGKYDLTSTYPSDTYDIEQLQPYGTAEQVDAFANAKIIGNPDENILTALGTVPTIDIPVMFYMRRVK